VVVGVRRTTLAVCSPCDRSAIEVNVAAVGIQVASARCHRSASGGCFTITCDRSARL
jgi:hypothetical protein